MDRASQIKGSFALTIKNGSPVKCDLLKVIKTLNIPASERHTAEKFLLLCPNNDFQVYLFFNSSDSINVCLSMWYNSVEENTSFDISHDSSTISYNYTGSQNALTIEQQIADFISSNNTIFPVIYEEEEEKELLHIKGSTEMVATQMRDYTTSTSNIAYVTNPNTYRNLGHFPDKRMLSETPVYITRLYPQSTKLSSRDDNNQEVSQDDKSISLEKTVTSFAEPNLVGGSV